MRKTIVAGVVLAALVLGGCTPMLERSMTTVQPHVQFSDERGTCSIRNNGQVCFGLDAFAGFQQLFWNGERS